MTAARSSSFLTRLTDFERALFDRFTAAQQPGEHLTFCVYHGYWGNKIVTAPFAGGDSRLADYLDRVTGEAPENHYGLLLALDLKRSFEAQWRKEPGTTHNLKGFIDQPMICIPGLPGSPYNRFTVLQGGLKP